MRLLLFFSLFLLLVRFYFTGRIFVIEDEAYYWFWSKHLSWGYPEHPPLVAWLIALFKDLFLIWPTIKFFDIRFVGVLLSIILFLVCYDWGSRLSRQQKTETTPLWLFPSLKKDKLSLEGTVFATLSQVIPYYYGTFFLITPDTPMVFMIFLTLYFYYRGIFEQKFFFYLGGVALGLSLLAKLTSLLPALGLLFFFLSSPITRGKLKNPKYFLHLTLSVAIGFLIFLPYILWNYYYDFPVLNNIARLVNVSTNLLDFLRFWGEQTLLYFPLFLPLLLILPFVELYKTFFSNPPKTPTIKNYQHNFNIYQQKKYFLVLVSIIPLLYFFYKSTNSYLRINWMGSTFMGSTALLALWLTENQKRWRTLRHFLMIIVIGFTFFITGLLYIVDRKFAPLNIVKPLLTQIYPKYEIFFDSYLVYDFFQLTFKSYYQQHMNKSLPIVSHNYQIPSIVNYYIRPETEAFGVASTNHYHLMTYYFLPKQNYDKQLNDSYYLLLKSQDRPDESVLQWTKKGQTISKVKSFAIRAEEETKGFDLYLIQ